MLRLFPDVLERLKLPETIIAVTGSNGKTSTTEMIVQTLEASGRSVGWNYEGSNQTEGVATLLLRIATFRGKVKRDAIVMENDERYAKAIFMKVKPSVLLITNLCRDQLSRNGHHEFIADCLRSAIEVLPRSTKLVLNADDPYVAALISPPMAARDDVLWFGVRSEINNAPRTGMYDDGAFCPVCKVRMSYAYRIVGHYGSYNCAECGLKRNDPDVEATTQTDGSLQFRPTVSDFIDRGNTGPTGNDSSPVSDGGVKMSLKLPSITGAYNFCAAVAAAKAAGVSLSDSVRALDGYELTGGRMTSLAVGKREGLLLVSKHENSLAYNTSMVWIAAQNKPCTVIVLVDAISRKYYTSETSWFWDVDFDILADDNVRSVVLAGRYVNELAARFIMTAVDRAKIGYVADLSDLRGYVEENTDGDIYVVTCFADKAKLLKALG